LAEAYDAVMNSPTTYTRIAMNLLSNYIPSVREIPLSVNKKFKHTCAIIERISEKLVEEKYKEAENGNLKGKDLLSLLININKTLPIEEKITDDEIKYQVIKPNILLPLFQLYTIRIIIIVMILDYDIFSSRT